jgi:hypothetical protein
MTEEKAIWEIQMNKQRSSRRTKLFWAVSEAKAKEAQ